MSSASFWTRYRSESNRPPRAREAAPRSLAESLRRTPLVGGVIRAYQDRLTQRGRFLLWATAIFAAVGLDTRRTQVFELFAVAAGGLLVALLYAEAPRPKVRLSCSLPSRATALVPVSLHARIEAEAGRSYPDLRFAIPRPRRGPGGLRVTPAESFVSTRPGVPAQVALELCAARRGRYELRGATVRWSDPLRLAAGLATAGEDQTLIVYPRFYPIDAFEIPMGRRYQPGGIPLSSNTGDAIEFVGTREYREGDPIRNIHWRSWARRGAPVVKEYQEEYFTRLALVLDTFLPRRPSPDDLAGFEAAISVLASLSDFTSRSESVVDILAAGPDVYEVSAGRSLAYLENILEVLACLEPCPDPPFAGVGPALFDKLSRITTVVAVLQDWDEARAAFLRKVKSLGTAVRILIVKQGATRQPWQGAAGELGEVTLLTPADVERLLARAEAARG